MQVLCTFGIKMLMFFEYMQVLCAAGGQKHAFFASHAGFGEVQVTKPADGIYAILKWTKLKLKPESGFDFLTIFYLVKE